MRGMLASLAVLAALVLQSGQAFPHPGELTSIVITPSNPTMQVGQSVTFTAEGRDQNGNPVTIQDPHWEAEHGTITPVEGSDPPQCTYTAVTEGNGYIMCYQGPPYQGGISGSTDITIQGGGAYLARIDVTPNDVSLQVGQQQQFTATGYDQNGNVYQITPIWSANGGTIDQTGRYTATVPGDFTVTSSVSGSTVTGTAGVHVDPAAYLARIEVSPNNVSLQVGQQQQFTAAGYDQNGNVYQIDPIWSANGGTIEQNGRYTATIPGDFTVTSSVSGSTVTGTAGVHVASGSCPDCSADAVVLQNVTFSSGMTCECQGAASITLRPGVIVEDGATVTFVTPSFKASSGTQFKNGSKVLVKQP